MRQGIACRIVLALLCLATLSGRIAPARSQAAGSTAVANSLVDAEDIALVGRLGGLMTKIVIRDGYGYVGVGDQLVILNVADPAQPKRVGSVRLADQIRDMVVAGQYAYVAANRAGLRIVDIADPAAPAEVGAFEPDLPPEVLLAQEVAHVAVAGQYAYLVTRDALQITGSLFVIDITNATALLEVGHYDMPDYPIDLQVAGRYVYLTGFQGVRVLDVGDPTRPTQVYLDIQSANGLALAGRYAYVATNAGLVVLDLSNPAAPTEVGRAELGSGIQVVVAGKYAYYQGGSTLVVVSLEDPIAPLEVGRYLSRSSIRDMTVIGDYAYIIDGDTLRIVQVREPSAAVEVGHFTAPTGGLSIVVAGQYAYVSNSRGFWIVDVTNPAVPLEVGYIDFMFDNLAGTHVVIQGQYAYVAGMYHGLLIIDISNPAAPVVVGRDARGSIYDVAVAGRYAYVITRTFDEDCLCVLDLANPAQPTLVARLPGTFNDLELAGQYLYLATYDDMLVMSLDKPAAPKQVSSLALPASQVTIVGSYAYVLNWSSNVQIVDITKPITPKQVGSLPVIAWSITARDKYVYVGSSRLQIFDVSNLAAPIEVGHAPMHGGVAGLAVGEQAIYAVSTGYDEGELAVFRYTGPSISGQVRHPNGMPFPGVTIDAGAGRTSSTDARGLYQLEVLPPGTYTVAPAAGGVVSWPAASTVTLPPSGRGHNFVLLSRPVSAALAPGTPGTLAYTDTQGLRTDLAIPAEAVTQTATLVVTPTLAPPDSGMFFTGHAVEVSARSGAADLSFAAPLTLTIRYSGADVRVVTDEAGLVLRWWDGRGWQDAGQTCAGNPAAVRDELQNALSVPICHAGRYALFGPTNQIYMPVLVH
jgi:hypothetical protein